MWGSATAGVCRYAPYSCLSLSPRMHCLEPLVAILGTYIDCFTQRHEFSPGSSSRYLLATCSPLGQATRSSAQKALICSELKFLNEKRLLFRARASAGTLFHALNLEIQFPVLYLVHVMDLIGSPGGGLLSGLPQFVQHSSRPVIDDGAAAAAADGTDSGSNGSALGVRADPL
eukprot:COSAG02_NODE_1620_length_11617_cov_3.185275_6_plen_173_part_00